MAIDFGKFGGPIYTGRKNGTKARQKCNLDKVDNEKMTVKVSIPSSTFSVNSSFFLGFFGDSIRKAGSKDSFLKKFNFKNDDHLKGKIDDWINRALFEKRPLINR